MLRMWFLVEVVSLIRVELGPLLQPVSHRFSTLLPLQEGQK